MEMSFEIKNCLSRESNKEIEQYKEAGVEISYSSEVISRKQISNGWEIIFYLEPLFEGDKIGEYEIRENFDEYNINLMTKVNTKNYDTMIKVEGEVNDKIICVKPFNTDKLEPYMFKACKLNFRQDDIIIYNSKFNKVIFTVLLYKKTL